MAATGYGPHASMRGNVFNSDKDDFELWEMKFNAQLRLNKLDSVLKTEPTEATRAAHNEKNIDIFSMLVMSLDDKSLSYIIIL